MTLLRALIFLLLLPLPALAQDNPILKRMAEYAAAFNAGDTARLASYYAPDAALLLPGERPILGRAAIEAHHAAAREAGARELQVKTFDIRPLGSDAAVEIGETVHMVGTRREVGRYMHLWQVIDGQLLLTREMTHVLLSN